MASRQSLGWEGAVSRQPLQRKQRRLAQELPGASDTGASPLPEPPPVPDPTIPLPIPWACPSLSLLYLFYLLSLILITRCPFPRLAPLRGAGGLPPSPVP